MNVQLPPKIYNRFDRFEGRYNFSDPTQDQIQYVLRLREEGRPEGVPRQASFVIPLEKDPGVVPDISSALECCEELLEIYKKYIYTKATKELPPIIAYLKAVQEQDEKDYFAWTVGEAEAMAAYWNGQVSSRSKVLGLYG